MLRAIRKNKLELEAQRDRVEEQLVVFGASLKSRF